MQYTLLLADADGTLFDFLAGEKIALRDTLSAFAIPCDDEIAAIYSRVNASHWAKLERGETTQQRLRTERFADFLLEMLARNLIALNAQTPTADQLSERYIEELAKQRIPMAGAEAFLQRVTAAGLPVYLVTNGISRIQRGRFEASELRPYLADILISEELGHFKPDPFMIFEAMRRAGVSDKSRVLLLGDSVTADIAAASNAGIDSVLFTNGAPAPENHGATCVCQTLAQAADVALR